MKKKFVVVSTTTNNGGPVVLHNLTKILSDMGYNAKIFYIGPSGPKNRLIFCGRYFIFLIKDIFRRRKVLPICRRKYLPFISKKTIVIYPELVANNFLYAKKVVRWLLYYNRYDYAVYGKNDLFVAYREIFNDYRLNPNCNILRTPYFDLNLYKKYNFNKRNGKCYIIRKGKNRVDLPPTFDGIIIDGKSEEEIVKIFNESEYCISYDTQTAYSSIASICGCISIVIPEPGKSKENYLSPKEERYGVGWGMTDKEIEYSIKTREDALKYLIELNKRSKESVVSFINLVDDYFKE